MAPDLNSLPPSRSTTNSPSQPRNMQTSPVPPSRQSTSSPGGTSLAAAAAMNAADRSRRSSSAYQTRGSPRLEQPPSDTERRRSQVATALNLNDPTLPGPGEMSSSDQRRSSITNSFSALSPPMLGGRETIATGDPHHYHHRQPSLGELHNELEQEQEAQVNRMLQMIRSQQQQLDALQQQRGLPESGERYASQATSAVDLPTPSSERSFSLSNRPSSISRHPSSANRSPALRPYASREGLTSNAEWSPVDSARRNSIRDESAYYQAETANLTRENQMLKLRIRELEKQVAELNDKQPNSPPLSSNLATV